MEFIGREDELRRLEGLWAKQGAQLAVLTGRRRIGKSRLIDKLGETKKVKYIRIHGLAPGEGVNKEQQLKNFSEQLNLHRKLPIQEPRNWTEAFVFLSKLVTGNGKTLILLDEISWMAKDAPDFPGKLKIAWDTLFKNHPNLVMVFCGSISSWIEHNILKKTDFLGRVSLHLHLEQLPLVLLKQFWGTFSNKISPAEKILFVMITGGVPRYLEELNPSISSGQNISQLCFFKGAFFVTEFEKIFNDIFERRAPIYKKILFCLLESKLPFTLICNKLKVEKNGSISKYLDDLVLSGFVVRDYVYSPEGKKTKKSLYRISDNYIRFYLKYILPQMDKINNNLLAGAQVETFANWNQIKGYQFENLILNNLPLILNELSISQTEVLSAAPYFQKKTARTKGACQIDLLISSRFSGLYICEIKMKQRITISVINELEKKISVLTYKGNFSIRPVLIYCGELDEEVIQRQFFSHIIDVRKWF